mgnify:CR=1 FL=1
MQGGKALAAGSYGCVFKPPLKCKNEQERPTHGVSKLLTKRHANQEMEETMVIYNLMKNMNFLILMRPTLL